TELSNLVIGSHNCACGIFQIGWPLILEHKHHQRTQREQEQDNHRSGDSDEGAAWATTLFFLLEGDVIITTEVKFGVVPAEIKFFVVERESFIIGDGCAFVIEAEIIVIEAEVIIWRSVAHKLLLLARV